MAQPNYYIIAAEPTGTTVLAKETAMREDVALQVVENFTYRYPGKRIILANEYAKPITITIAPEH